MKKTGHTATAVVAIVMFILFLGLGGFVFITSGMYNIAASSPHTPIVETILNETMEYSVHRHARVIAAPDLTDAAMVAEGAAHFREDCVRCHGAPGIDREDFAWGLNPLPPYLAAALEDFSPAEIFWVASHGIKMTGMPAFGTSETPDKLWQIVALIEQMPNLSPEQYGAMIAGLRNEN